MNRDQNPLIKVKNLKKYFPINKKILKAVDNVSFEIQRSHTLALVGESGSGKTTVGKTILRLLHPTDGEIFFENENILKIKKFKKFRKKMQIIFQDPYASLNPRMTVKEIIEEPLKIHKIKNKKRAEELMDLVKMPSFFLKKFPHEFSGGQRQRIGIARALSLNPKFLVLDEPVSALDVSIQAQIINLLKELQKELQLTYLFIAHDLAVVRHIATNVAVMYSGQIVEYGSSEKIFKNPKHPYSKTLLEAVLMLDFNFKKEKAAFPKNENFSYFLEANGCPFSSRCKKAKNFCFFKKPEMKEIENNHFAACHSL
jgi:oligopeptide transport system ATP-binding protein